MITGTAHGDHFVAAEFDEERAAHGTPALWRRARLCPCVDARTGHAAIDCGLCETGLLWDDGQPITILALRRTAKPIYDETGQQLKGMASATFPTGITPAHLDRLELQIAVMAVNNEVHTRGDLDGANRSTERLRVAPALSVEFCEAIIPPPPALGGVITAYAIPTDFTVNPAGDILWVAGHGPPTGAQYTMRYTARPTFLCWDPPGSRDEGGNRMPYQGLVQRLDFFRRKAVGEA